MRPRCHLLGFFVVVAAALVCGLVVGLVVTLGVVVAGTEAEVSMSDGVHVPQV